MLSRSSRLAVASKLEKTRRETNRASFALKI
jgi:hypothetical protein